MDDFLDKYIFPYTKKIFGRAKKTEDGFPIYSDGEEKLNTLTHIFGIFIGFAMMITGILKSHSEYELAGGIIFGSALVVLYTASSLYHGTPIQKVSEKKTLRTFDHCSIFVLVAGTCSPIVLSKISISIWNEWFFYAAIWAIAISGIVMLCIDIKNSSLRQ